MHCSTGLEGLKIWVWLADCTTPNCSGWANTLWLSQTLPSGCMQSAFGVCFVSCVLSCYNCCLFFFFFWKCVSLGCVFCTVVFTFFIRSLWISSELVCRDCQWQHWRRPAVYAGASLPDQGHAGAWGHTCTPYCEAFSVVFLVDAGTSWLPSDSPSERLLWNSPGWGVGGLLPTEYLVVKGTVLK